MSPGALLARLLTVAVLAASMLLAVGAPDFGAVGSFVVGGRPTAGGELATAVLVLWTAVLAGAGVSAATLVRRGRFAALVGSRSLGAVLCAVAGAVALAAGTLHHLTNPYSICCGATQVHVQEARQLVR